MIGGGTIVVPEITYGRRKPAKALLLGRAGLDTLSRRRRDRDGRRGPAGPSAVRARAGRRGARAECALNVADYEIRGQGTVGGNICATAAADAPRGDLQGPFLALEATARSVGAGGETTRAAGGRSWHDREGRLLLDAQLREARGLGVRRARVPAHPRVHGARRHGRAHARAARRGSRRPASRATGRGCASAEAAASDPDAAGEAAARRRHARRRRARVRLVPGAGASRPRPPCPREARGGGMNLTVNGVAHDVASTPLTTLARRAPRGARRDEPQGGLRAGRLRRVHGSRRRRAAARVPHAPSRRSTAPR